MMKQVFKSVLVVTFLILTGCGGEKDPEPQVDCTLSDLEITVVESNDVADCDATDGSITVLAQGGEGDISYSINGVDFQSSGSFTNLAVGKYTLIAKDHNQCEVTVAGAVNVEGSTLNISNITAIHAGCGESNGEINIAATGEGTILYQLNGGAFQDSNTFSGLTAGTYDVAITDDSNCQFTDTKEVLNGTSYEQQVNAIITTNCAINGCHNGDNGASRNWTVFSNVQAKASEIKFRTQNGIMPPPGSGIILTQEQKDLIACWVDDGALNN